jgi:hypothetical protein
MQPRSSRFLVPGSGFVFGVPVRMFWVLVLVFRVRLFGVPVRMFWVLVLVFRVQLFGGLVARVFGP